MHNMNPVPPASIGNSSPSHRLGSPTGNQYFTNSDSASLQSASWITPMEAAAARWQYAQARGTVSASMFVSPNHEENFGSRRTSSMDLDSLKSAQSLKQSEAERVNRLATSRPSSPDGHAARCPLCQREFAEAVRNADYAEDHRRGKQDETIRSTPLRHPLWPREFICKDCHDNSVPCDCCERRIPSAREGVRRGTKAMLCCNCAQLSVVSSEDFLRICAKRALIFLREAIGLEFGQSAIEMQEAGIRRSNENNASNFSDTYGETVHSHQRPRRPVTGTTHSPLAKAYPSRRDLSDRTSPILHVTRRRASLTYQDQGHRKIRVQRGGSPDDILVAIGGRAAGHHRFPSETYVQSPPIKFMAMHSEGYQSYQGDTRRKQGTSHTRQKKSSTNASSPQMHKFSQSPQIPSSLRRPDLFKGGPQRRRSVTFDPAFVPLSPSAPGNRNQMSMDFSCKRNDLRQQQERAVMNPTLPLAHGHRPQQLTFPDTASATAMVSSNQSTTGRSQMPSTLISHGEPFSKNPFHTPVPATIDSQSISGGTAIGYPGGAPIVTRSFPLPAIVGNAWGSQSSQMPNSGNFSELQGGRPGLFSFQDWIYESFSMSEMHQQERYAEKVLAAVPVQFMRSKHIKLGGKDHLFGLCETKSPSRRSPDVQPHISHIRIRSGLTELKVMATLCHEFVHGWLFLGRHALPYQKVPWSRFNSLECCDVEEGLCNLAARKLMKQLCIRLKESDLSKSQMGLVARFLRKKLESGKHRYAGPFQLCLESVRDVGWQDTLERVKILGTLS